LQLLHAWMTGYLKDPTTGWKVLQLLLKAMHPTMPLFPLPCWLCSCNNNNRGNCNNSQGSKQHQQLRPQRQQQPQQQQQRHQQQTGWKH